MKEEEIPDLNVFMICEELDRSALSEVPYPYTIRNITPTELDTWESFPFDAEEEALEYQGFMTEFFENTYRGQEDVFFQNTLFVCDENNKSVSTCSNWKAYGKFESIHWFKTKKSYKSKGLGRAVLSAVMDRFSPSDYPIYLHTHPVGFRAIKLYSDFGFKILADPVIGNRENHYLESMEILREFMPTIDYNRLQFCSAPTTFLNSLENESFNQF